MAWYLLIGLVAACAFGLLLEGLGRGAVSTPETRLRGLNDKSRATLSISPPAMKQAFSQRVVRPALMELAGLADKLGLAGDTHLLQEKLDAAGHPRLLGAPMGVREFMAIKALALILAVASFILLIRHPLIRGPLVAAQAALVALCLGLAPTVYLDHTADRRKQLILRGLSDVLDLLVVSTEAGLSLDAAMARVARKRSGPLSEEFDAALREMQLGISRAEALRNLARRTGVQEIRMFVNAVIQAENLGVSIAEVLRTQADSHRERRTQVIREGAAKLPVKILFPMVFCILPSLFVVLAAPGIIQVIRAISSSTR